MSEVCPDHPDSVIDSVITQMANPFDTLRKVNNILANTRQTRRVRVPARGGGVVSAPFFGIRVEISPSHDLWTQGARYGTILKLWVRGDGQPIADVRMDHPAVKKIQRFKVSDLSARVARLIGPKGVTCTPETHLTTGQTVYLINFAGDGIEVTPEVPPSKTHFFLKAADFECRE